MIAASDRGKFISERLFINRGGVVLSVLVAGEGAPVVLVPGLGRGADMWSRQRDALAGRFRTVALDNRGAGWSDKPAGPYSIEMMADDVAAVLDVLGLPRAHLVGASLGGFVAQEFALRHPGRIRRLVLCCTSAGGSSAVRMTPETWRILAQSAGDRSAAALLRAVRLAFSPAYFADHAREIADEVRERLQAAPPPQCWFAQAEAGARFDASGRVGRIACPTLILTGREDMIVPAENSRHLHAAIPDSRLVELDGAGHYVMVERAEDVNRAVLEFLSEEPS